MDETPSAFAIVPDDARIIALCAFASAPATTVVMPAPDPVDDWVTALVERHTHTLSTPEFLKAVRALSARYVERRAELPRRPPTDSAGKRAAFAGFFAPLHFLTTRRIISSLGSPGEAPAQIVDLGCGTGAAAAAWALQYESPPRVIGVDRQSWALEEAAWNWQQLGLRGRTRRADLLRAAVDLTVGLRDSRSATRGPRRASRGRGCAGVVLAWSANELGLTDRERLLPTLLALGEAGASVLVVEPLARGATPWWEDWAGAWRRAGGRADEWKFDAALPPVLQTLSDAARFHRESLSARTLWLPGRR